MAIKRLMRETRTVLLIPCVEIAGVLNVVGGTSAAPVLAPLSAPTSAILNKWQNVRKSKAADAQMGGNISATLLDNAKIGLAASATESALTIISVGNEVDPTMNKVEASLEFFMDESSTDDSAMNLPWQLLRRGGVRYVIADRVQGGKKWTTPFAKDDYVSFYDVTTTDAVDNIGDQKNTTFSATLIPSGQVNPNHRLSA